MNEPTDAPDGHEIPRGQYAAFRAGLRRAEERHPPQWVGSLWRIRHKGSRKADDRGGAPGAEKEEE